jgi:hypothetical protein
MVKLCVKGKNTLFYETFYMNDMEKTRHLVLVSNYTFTDENQSVYGCIYIIIY